MVLRQFLSSRPRSERIKLRTLFEKLCQCCDDLCISTLDGSEDTPAPNRDFQQDEATRKACSTAEFAESSESHLTVYLRPEGEPDDSVKPLLTPPSNMSQLQTKHETRGNSAECTKSMFDLNDDDAASNSVPEFGMRYEDPSDLDFSASPAAFHESHEYKSGNDRISEDASPSALVTWSDSDSNEAAVEKATAQAPSYSKPALPTQLLTSRDTPRKGRTSKPDSNVCSAGDQPSWPMVVQSDSEFASESYHQVVKFKAPMNSPQTYATILTSVKQGRQHKPMWSDGKEWRSLIETASQDRQRSSIQYALTAIALSRWREDQVTLSTLEPRAAAEEVSKRLLGPVPEDAGEKQRRQQHRKNLNTHLARGRKWATLVDHLGFGILLKNIWKLAKAEGPLPELIAGLQQSPRKMFILRLLGKQVDFLLEKGQTCPDVLGQSLRGQGLLDLSPPSSGPETATEIADLQASMKAASHAGEFQIHDGRFRFHVDVLDDLNGTSWLCDTLVLLSLHLADKLSHMRVGFSIPLHQNIRGRERKALRDPFERAANQIEEWNGNEDQLVCFSPFFRTTTTSAFLRSIKQTVLYITTTRKDITRVISK
ncbi:hypothetical protein GGR52DRAFT_585358 [Hypoxylon sp. FL1284]|nr:hypothetical protein GGR52DRAFT_585358 [Hypoxylon sp. FL1284]